VEEFLVQWNSEDCTLQEALTQQAQGFVITSIHSLDEGVSTPLIQAATAASALEAGPEKRTASPPRLGAAYNSHPPHKDRTTSGQSEVAKTR
jgi:hypothetical protein